MTLEEIRKNAPDGATHYSGIKKIGYFKKARLKWYLNINGEWWGEYKECHDIYWFFRWMYRHRFVNNSESFAIKPLP